MTRIAAVLVFLVMTAPLGAETCGNAEAVILEAEGASAALVLPDGGIAVGEGFSLQVEMCTQGWRIEGLSARMPAHGHGMNYRPTLHETGSGIRVDGMLFHMPGVWEVNATLSNRDERRQATAEITLKPSPEHY